MTLSKDALLITCNNLLTILASKISSSNQIISRLELPSVIGSKLGEYEQRFGKEPVADLVAYFKRLDKLRDLADQVTEARNVTESPGATSVLATSLLGIGESQEHTMLAAHELSFLGITNISVVTTISPVKSQGHSFLVLNGSGHLRAGDNVSAFKHCVNSIILDPYLRVAFCASEGNDQFDRFVEQYECHRILKINILTHVNYKKTYDTSYEIAMQIAKKELNRFFYTDEWKCNFSTQGRKLWLQDKNEKNLEGKMDTLKTLGVDVAKMSIRKTTVGTFVLMLEVEPEVLSKLNKLINNTEVSVNASNATKSRMQPVM